MKDTAVNATIEAVENIYFKKDWRNILQQRGVLRIPTKNPLQAEIKDQPDTIWDLIDRDQIITVEDENPFLEHIKTNPECVQKMPNDIFFVDRKTKSLFKNVHSGVCILPEKSASPVFLKDGWNYRPVKNQPLSWDKILNESEIKKSMPTNAVVLIDRYIFSLFDEGLQNVMDLLDTLLPDEFSGEFHVLIVTDDLQTLKDEKKGFKSIGSAVSEIMDLVPFLDRKYVIRLELLFVHDTKSEHNPKENYKKTKDDRDRDAFYYGSMHDRLFLANYYLINATKGFDAIVEDRNNNLVSKDKQDISYQAIYLGIDKKHQSLSELPVKTRDDFVRAARQFINSPNPLCTFFSDGVKGSVKDMRNRLIVNE